jgi:septal ring factor EnvC (AmiA/AmiB activator)
MTAGEILLLSIVLFSLAMITYAGLVASRDLKRLQSWSEEYARRRNEIDQAIDRISNLNQRDDE